MVNDSSATSLIDNINARPFTQAGLLAKSYDCHAVSQPLRNHYDLSHDGAIGWREIHHAIDEEFQEKSQQ